MRVSLSFGFLDFGLMFSHHSSDIVIRLDELNARRFFTGLESAGGIAMRRVTLPESSSSEPAKVPWQHQSLVAWHMVRAICMHTQASCYAGMMFTCIIMKFVNVVYMLKKISIYIYIFPQDKIVCAPTALHLGGVPSFLVHLSH